jgi:serine/threonine protein kinase
MEDSVADKMVTSVCAHCGNVIDVTGLEPGDGITCPYCGKEFSITRQFGNFLLERQLGSGGMGTVYLGRDMTLKREVAVKVLKPELVNDQKFIATFLREAEITASLNHPDIVQVYAFGKHENVYYLVVEYISGGSLDDKIMNRGKITELEGIEIGIAVARGLECALRRGLIHRDIKPGNILFSANNTPKVVDFGLSLSFETADHFDGEIWGTPYYVAPEKLERRPEDFRSDLYSLGATLFHAISGRPPYEGEDPNDVAMKHLNGNVVSLKAFVPGISDQTAYAVSKAMARHPEDRYDSYAEFISQLEDAKRRITDPHFREKQQEQVVILETTESAKYKGIMIMGVVMIIFILLGTILWKGSALFEKGTASAQDLVDPFNKPPAGNMPTNTAPTNTTLTSNASTNDVSETQRIRASSYNAISGSAVAQTRDSEEAGEQNIGNISNGSYTEYNNINLDGMAAFQARVSDGGPTNPYPGVGGNINIHLDSLTGTLIGTATVTPTGGWTTYATVNCNLSGTSGTHNVYLVFTGPPGWLFNLEWFDFEHATQSPAPAPPSASQSVAPETIQPTGGIQLEAEAATKIQSVNVMDDSAASGGKVVGNLYIEGNGIAFDNVPAATSLTLKYASVESGTFSLYVNGTKVAKLEFTANHVWTGSYVFKTFAVNIPAGATLKLQHDEGDASLNIDYIILK